MFVTGGAGFIGRSVCRQLRARGDEVVAVVRDPGRAADLEALGCEVRAGDLASPEALTGGMRSCDGVIHLAGSYRIGIPARERPQMYEANVGGDASRARGGDRDRRSTHRPRIERQRPGQHPREDRGRDVPSRHQPGVPELLRRDQAPGPRRGARVDQQWRPGPDRDARHHLRSRRSFRALAASCSWRTRAACWSPV